MQLSIFLIMIGMSVVVDGDAPKGLHFVGVGYNLLEGNPEGGDVTNGGVDPGLLFTRKIFKLTWNTNKKSMDNRFSVPDQVTFAPRSSCVTTNKKEVFSGSKSYQEKLNADVQVSGNYGGGLLSVAFSLSSRFEKMKKETSEYHNVFYEDKHVCNKGRARYQLDLAPVKKFPVSADFAATVCALPGSYNEKAYFNFLEDWGTHIVVEVDLGEKTTERFKSSKAEFTKYAMMNSQNSVSVSGSYMGFSASLKVDVNAFKESMSKDSKFGEHKVVFKSGGPNMPEPIGLKLVPIAEAFDPAFYSVLDQQKSARCVNSNSLLKARRTAVIRALKEYPRLKKTVKPLDPEVRIPLTWPKGTYGLPMPKSGCPKGSNFQWHAGYRSHDTEDTRGNNKWSSPFDLAGPYYRRDMTQKFCMKTKDKASDYNLPWPRGQYCILKKGECPEGFTEGHIKWDDEDLNNKNRYGGQVPDGRYDRNTVLYYCCRADGHATNPIILPTDSPFVLLKSNTHLCQHVRGMKVRSEWFQWDCEDSRPSNGGGGFRPRSHVGKNVAVDYCYYYR
ncbi:uncharacterized protein [Porites lutea]|uniref:uncharacterized protein n=1 Tax=Porites lutea TaxID=51062 RepID=UPI003CC69F19